MQCIETSLGKFTHFAEDLLARASHETIELPATPCNTRVRTRGLKMLVFRKILRTYLMDGPKTKLSIIVSEDSIAAGLKRYPTSTVINHFILLME